MKILLSAYSVAPGRGSEAGAGWAFLEAASRLGEVTVVTRIKHAPVLRASGLATKTIGIDLPQPWLAVKHIFVTKCYYTVWQALAYRCMRRELRAESYDVAHHVTFAVDWLPSAVAFLHGVRTVIGPVGGSGRLAAGGWRWLGPKGAAVEVARQAGTSLLRRIVSSRALRRASKVIYQNDGVARLYGATHGHVIAPNVVLESELSQANRSPAHRTITVACRLLPWKGVAIAVSALRKPGLEEWKLRVVGDGPDLARLHRIARRWRVNDRVEFMGRKSHRETLDLMSESHVFLALSLHEAAGFSLAEATALGVPTVYIDHAGQGLIGRMSGAHALSPGSEMDDRLAELIRGIDSSRVPASALWSQERLLDLLYTSYTDGERSAHY